MLVWGMHVMYLKMIARVYVCNGQSSCVVPYVEQVLVDELDYLAEEVDDMDPQIAAVVIEKSLPRPRAGK